MEDVETKYVALTTRGPGGSQFLDTLTKHGKGAFGNNNGMGSKEHTEFLNSGLMVVQNSRWGEVTRRIFEGMACGKLVLTDRLKDSKKLQELFIEGQEIVFYDDIVDCINKMNHFTEHEKVRKGIAEKGMKKVLENHTQVQRVSFIIRQYNRWKSLQGWNINNQTI
jgi:spore maturation protein CgeB